VTTAPRPRPSLAEYDHDAFKMATFMPIQTFYPPIYRGARFNFARGGRFRKGGKRCESITRCAGSRADENRNRRCDRSTKSGRSTDVEIFSSAMMRCRHAPELKSQIVPKAARSRPTENATAGHNTKHVADASPHPGFLPRSRRKI